MIKSILHQNYTAGYNMNLVHNYQMKHKGGLNDQNDKGLK